MKSEGLNDSNIIDEESIKKMASKSIDGSENTEKQYNKLGSNHENNKYDFNDHKNTFGISIKNEEYSLENNYNNIKNDKKEMNSNISNQNINDNHEKKNTNIDVNYSIKASENIKSIKNENNQKEASKNTKNSIKINQLNKPTQIKESTKSKKNNKISPDYNVSKSNDKNMVVEKSVKKNISKEKNITPNLNNNQSVKVVKPVIKLKNNDNFNSSTLTKKKLPPIKPLASFGAATDTDININQQNRLSVLSVSSNFNKGSIYLNATKKARKSKRNIYLYLTQFKEKLFHLINSYFLNI